MILVVVGSVLAIPAAQADRRGVKIDRFVFMRADAQGFWQVWVADRHPRNARQLTFSAANNGFATLSPDGRKIAFDSDINDPDPNSGPLIDDIFVMNVDGSKVTQVSRSDAGPSGDPAWSPDGSSIAFQSAAGALPERQGIFVMRADGSHLRRVTTVPPDSAADFTPRFSPDGRRLVFTRYAPDGEGSAVFTTDLHGRTRQVTSFEVGAGDAVWSPRGDRIVFEAGLSEGRGDVYSVGADGRQLQNLTKYRGNSGGADPVWSPDGKRIMFQESLDGSEHLTVMRADGNHRRIVDHAGDHQPDWRRVPARQHRQHVRLRTA